MEKITLADCNPGFVGKVLSYTKGGVYKEKLLAMGLIKGTRFAVENVAPLGDPVKIQLRGFNLSVRKSEAREVIVEEIKEVSHASCSSCGKSKCR